MRMIRKAFKEEIPGTTKLIIAQRISSVQDSDIILVMENGHVACCGQSRTPHERIRLLPGHL